MEQFNGNVEQVVIEEDFYKRFKTEHLLIKFLEKHYNLTHNYTKGHTFYFKDNMDFTNVFTHNDMIKNLNTNRLEDIKFNYSLSIVLNPREMILEPKDNKHYGLTGNELVRLYNYIISTYYTK